MIDNEMKEFFLSLDEESFTLIDCENHVKKAISFIIDSIKASKIEILTSIPKNKYLPNGIEYCSVLFDDQSNGVTTFSKEEPYKDGGQSKIVLTFNSEDYDKEMTEIVASYVLKYYTRSIQHSIIDYILHHDLDTGAASPASLMGHIVSLKMRNIIDDYYINFFNIHNFKYVNKVFSYAEGDIVLLKYTKSVIALLEPNEILARMGGDNFVAIVHKKNEKKFIDYIQNLAITHKNETKELTLTFGATIGCASLVGVNNPRDAMARVSIAYQKARRVASGSVVEFSDSILQEIMYSQTILSNFKDALKNKEFIVYYQPKVNVKDNSIYGAEALVRWFKDGRLIPPMEFIPILEQDGSICQLDFYVLDAACQFLRERIDSGKEPIHISVNLSRKHLDNENLVNDILRIIDKYHIEHKYIEIELTESDNYQNYEVIANIIESLHKANVLTSIDDFGTGYSSLNMIKEIDVEFIKLDKSLIPVDNFSEKNTALFKNIVNLVTALGRTIVAEGVETKEQLKYVKDAGCQIIQGYVYDKPLPENEFVTKLDTGYKI